MLSRSLAREQANEGAQRRQTVSGLGAALGV